LSTGGCSIWQPIIISGSMASTDGSEVAPPLPPAPSFLSTVPAVAACHAHLFTRHNFADGSSIFALPTSEVDIDGHRAQLEPVAQMCIAVYAYEWLSAYDAAGGECPPRRAFRGWHLLLRLLEEFWLLKQATLSAEMQDAAHVLGRVDDHGALRTYLSGYLRARGLPEDAAARPTTQHRMLFGGKRPSKPSEGSAHL
jgi:hypothetical protein